MKWLGVSDRNYSVQRGIDAPHTTLILLGRAFELTTDECRMIARDLQHFADTADEFSGSASDARRMALHEAICRCPKCKGTTDKAKLCPTCAETDSSIDAMKPNDRNQGLAPQGETNA